jgi:hypothetical protein
MHKPASTRLLCYAIRLLGARMTDSRSAGISALLLVVAPVGASIQTGLAIGRRGDGGRGLGIAFLGGGPGLRQAHGSLRSKSKTRRQRCQQNAQHKAHDGISLHLHSFLLQRTTRAWDACAAALVLKMRVGDCQSQSPSRTECGRASSHGASALFSRSAECDGQTRRRGGW